MAERKADARPVAEVIDGVRWDYDPQTEEVSPLVSTERYFRDFPWDGDDDKAAVEKPAS